MFGKKKTTGTATPVPQVSNKKKIEDCLTSMSFLSHFVIDKKESLVEEEIKTVREIDKVKDSYTDVIEHNASIREAVDSLQKEFGKIGEISRQFTKNPSRSARGFFVLRRFVVACATSHTDKFMRYLLRDSCRLTAAICRFLLRPFPVKK